MKIEGGLVLFDMNLLTTNKFNMSLLISKKLDKSFGKVFGIVFDDTSKFGINKINDQIEVFVLIENIRLKNPIPTQTKKQ